MDLLCERYADARTRLARFFNADENEIALTANVSTGVSIVAQGLKWSAGDEIIMTDQEHPSGGLPWISMARQHGVEIKLLSIDGEQAAVQERLEGMITPRTRLIFTSEVSCYSGIRLPVKKIAGIARAHGVLSMIDGAHAVGVVPVDMREIGCDFYAANCHKWLMGPQGTAFLFVREDRLDEVSLTWSGAGATKEWSMPDMPFEPVDGARRYEFGSHPYILFSALATSLDFIESLGLASIRAYAVELTTMLKDALSEVRGVTITTPVSPDESASLVAINTSGLTEPVDSPQMWRDHDIIVPANADTGWMRVSCACFTLPEELDRLVGLLRERQPAD
jgi:selenocysteine lyase/cysteine desulfurase